VNRTSRWVVAPAAAVLALSLVACGDDDNGGNSDVSGEVAVDGSSTVYPMSVAAAELLAEDAPNVAVLVGNPPKGTGGGFELFCAGTTDISDASRPIKEDEEVPVCEDAGIEYTELQVAIDALTIAVNPDLGVDCLTVDQIARLFGPEDSAKNWQDLDPSFPNEEITGFIPGTDSGTYDYMANDVWDNESEVLRDDFQSSEDDNVLVEGVANTPGAVGFFGYSYYEENADKLKAVSVDAGDGTCVAPSAETAADGSYTPLSRPLFIYVSNASYADNEAVKAYVDFYVENMTTIASEAGFIALNDELAAATSDALAGISS
jgi:phosphate transport system substrate-binding protein